MRRLVRLLRNLLLVVLLLALLPIACVVGGGLVRGRDLAGAWRALRAPGPQPVAHEVTLPLAPFGPPVQVGSLLDPELVEVSGLARSQRRADVLWAENDGGNPQRLYALDLHGHLLRAYDVDVPEPRSPSDSDWEDLASFRLDGKPWLLVPDVGDNRSWRRHVRLWIVEEPDPAQPARLLEPRARIDLRYEDGPHDCEAVAVDADGVALLVSKRTAPPVLYQVDLAPLLAAGGGEAVARRVAELAGIPPPSEDLALAWSPAMLHMPTGLDLAPDGSAAVVLTYAAGFRFPRRPGQSWAQALAGRPERIFLPPLALAEAVAYVGDSLYVTSEMDPIGLVRWRAPLMRMDPLVRTAGTPRGTAPQP